jgi:hypothetical protein
VRVAIAVFTALIVGLFVANLVDDADTSGPSILGPTIPSAATAPPAIAVAPPSTTVPPLPVTGALCVGDSVMLAASEYGALTMCATIDAIVSRQASEGPAAVAAHAPYPSAVILHLGTNGTVSHADIDAMMGALRGVPAVVLVTVQLNGLRPWEDQANQEIAAAADRWPNVRLADWKAASSGHPEYFREDGFHPTLAGAQAYATTITSAS